MSKRCNPFVEDFVPQSKRHVGLKQFNNNEKRLKKVYEKTLALLYQGAKKLPVQEVNNGCHTVCENRKDRMKQLFITKDGSLLHSGDMHPKKSSTALCDDCDDTAPKSQCAYCDDTAPESQCAYCDDTAPESQCAYCEIALCANCQHHCVHCQQEYCSQCSILGSGSSEVCLSCYG